MLAKPIYPRPVSKNYLSLVADNDEGIDGANTVFVWRTNTSTGSEAPIGTIAPPNADSSPRLRPVDEKAAQANKMALASRRQGATAPPGDRDRKSRMRTTKKSGAGGDQKAEFLALPPQAGTPPAKPAKGKKAKKRKKNGACSLGNEASSPLQSVYWFRVVLDEAQ